MSRYVTPDGEVIEWTGKRVSICTKCHVAFNSVGAFDHHLRSRKGKPPHYHEDMPYNSQGFKVIALMPDSIVEKVSNA